jgi:anti-anti-sigma factor
VLVGDLDLATAPALEDAVARLCGEGAREIVLDLKELEFLDSTGFRAVLAGKDVCEGHGCVFAMTRGKEPVQRVFDVSGVLKKLPFVHG